MLFGLKFFSALVLPSAAEDLYVKNVVSDVNYDAVRADILGLMNAPSWDDGSYAPLLIRLAWHSSATYNRHDGTGGSNGATMRFALEANDPQNVGLSHARDLLEPLISKHAGLSHSDLWILAAYTALEHTNGPKIDFVGGRVDKSEDEAIKPGRLPDAERGLDPGMTVDSKGRLNGWRKLAGQMRKVFDRLGFSDRESVALLGGGHAYGRCHKEFTGYEGAWMENPTYFATEYCEDMAGDDWTAVSPDKHLSNGAFAPDDLRPSKSRRQYIDLTTLDPCADGACMRDDDHHTTTLTPGQYKVVTSWINARETLDPLSPVLARITRNDTLSILRVEMAGSAAKGLAAHGGWVVLDPDSGTDGDDYCARTGDLDEQVLGGSYRRLANIKTPLPLYLGPHESSGRTNIPAPFDQINAGQDFDCDSAHVTDDDVWCQLSSGSYVKVFESSEVSVLAELRVKGYNYDERRVPIRDNVGHQMMLPSDMVLRWDEDFHPILIEFGADEDLLRAEFGAAFKRLTEFGCSWSQDQPANSLVV